MKLPIWKDLQIKLVPESGVDTSTLRLQLTSALASRYNEMNVELHDMMTIAMNPEIAWIAGDLDASPRCRNNNVTKSKQNKNGPKERDILSTESNQTIDDGPNQDEKTRRR